MAKKSVDLTSLEWTNLIFEGKNKDFGAYQLRRKSDRRHNLAVIYTLLGLVIVALLIWGLSVYNDWKLAREMAERDALAKQEQIQAQMAEQEQPEEEQPEEQKFEPEVPVIEEEVLQTVKQTQIAIVKEEEVKNKVMTVEEQNESNDARGVETVKGSDDADHAKQVETQMQTAHPEPAPVVKIEEPKKEEPKPSEAFRAVEQQAQFPGGQAALSKWLSNNLRYPERAQQNDIQGRVIVEFIVNLDGSIQNVKVIKGVDKDLDNEAIRVVKKMPKWQPGKNNGVAVRSYFTLPVNFKLQK